MPPIKMPPGFTSAGLLTDHFSTGYIVSLIISLSVWFLIFMWYERRSARESAAGAASARQSHVHLGGGSPEKSDKR